MSNTRRIQPKCIRCHRRPARFRGIHCRPCADKFPCLDCDTPTGGECYMVQNALWAAAGMEPEGGLLCIECLEKRLGRELTGVDFTDVPINDPARRGIPMSERLLDRLGRKAAA